MNVLILGGYGFAASCLPRAAGRALGGLARRADSEGTPLPTAYRELVRRWVALGFVGFAALIGAFWVMVFKPA